MVTSLIGARAHGSDIEAIWKRVHKYKRLHVYDDDPMYGTVPPENLTGAVIFGVNNPQQRWDAYHKHALPGAAPLIDPTASLGFRIKMQPGVVVAPRVTMLQDVYLGSHVHVNYHASMIRCRIGAFSTVSPAATICGDVKIGKRVLVGANATICDRVTIGDDAIIAAGAIVPPGRHVPDGTTVMGVWKP